MRASEAKVLLMKRKLKEFPIDWSIDGLPELDGQLSMLEMPMQEIKNASDLAEGRDGKPDEMLIMAAMIAKALVSREDKERLYTDNELEQITAWGAMVMKPLAELAAKASGLDKEAAENAKKN